jgi:DNA-binding HxlR family transcriptional regulator
MSKENKSTNADSEKDALLDASVTLDDTCFSIFRVLLECKTYGFNDLRNAVTKMSDKKLTNKVLSKHLKHLISKNLVKQTKEARNVKYSLSDKFRAIHELPREELIEYLKHEDDNLPPEFRALDITEEQWISNLSGEEVDLETDRDLDNVLSLILWELKLSIDYDLKLRQNENEEAFWNFVSKPMYRICEKDAVEKCRYNAEYKEMLY